MRKIIAGVLAGVAALVVSSGLTAPAASAAGPVGQLTLTLSGSPGGPGTQVTLTCEPTGGTHPNAEAACRDLIAADGDIAAIPREQDVACPAFIEPVFASATGTWAGHPDTYQQRFANSCWAVVLTGGHLFGFF